MAITTKNLFKRLMKKHGIFENHSLKFENLQMVRNFDWNLLSKNGLNKLIVMV
jgi:hypothetical protein